jgi:hypothetical protein
VIGTWRASSQRLAWKSWPSPRTQQTPPCSASCWWEFRFWRPAELWTQLLSLSWTLCKQKCHYKGPELLDAVTASITFFSVWHCTVCQRRTNISEKPPRPSSIRQTTRFLWNIRTDLLHYKGTAGNKYNILHIQTFSTKRPSSGKGATALGQVDKLVPDSRDWD